MRLYIVRHGDPDYTHDCLTDAGRVEASALGSYLAEIGLDRLYASPLGRAQETASYAARATGLPIQTLDWTRELPWERMRGSEHGYWDIPGYAVRVPEYLEHPNDWRTLEPLQGLSADIDAIVAQVARNSDAFLATLGYERRQGAYRITAPNTEKIAVVCHGGFGSVWMSHLLAIPFPLVWSGFFMSTTSITTVLFEERAPGIACPRCLRYGETPHFYKDAIATGWSGLKVPLA